MNFPKEYCNLCGYELDCCVCFMCKDCHEPYLFNEIIKVSPGEFICLDCATSIADSANDYIALEEN